MPVENHSLPCLYSVNSPLLLCWHQCLSLAVSEERRSMELRRAVEVLQLWEIQSTRHQSILGHLHQDPQAPFQETHRSSDILLQEDTQMLVQSDGRQMSGSTSMENFPCQSYHQDRPFQNTKTMSFQPQ